MPQPLSNPLSLSTKLGIDRDNGIHFVLDGHEVDEATFHGSAGQNVDVPGFGTYSESDWFEAGVANAPFNRSAEMPCATLLRNQRILSGEVALMYELYDAPGCMGDLDRAFATARRIDKVIKATGIELTPIAAGRLMLVLETVAEVDRQAESDARFGRNVFRISLISVFGLILMIHYHSVFAAGAVLTATIATAAVTLLWLHRGRSKGNTH